MNDWTAGTVELSLRNARGADMSSNQLWYVAAGPIPCQFCKAPTITTKNSSHFILGKVVFSLNRRGEVR